jgi:hypothetical protein
VEGYIKHQSAVPMNSKWHPAGFQGRNRRWQVNYRKSDCNPMGFGAHEGRGAVRCVPEKKHQKYNKNWL